jgi:hypothetical protein
MELKPPGWPVLLLSVLEDYFSFSKGDRDLAASHETVDVFIA